MKYQKLTIIFLGGNAGVDITLCNTMDTIVSFCQDAGYTVSVSYRSVADCRM